MTEQVLETFWLELSGHGQRCRSLPSYLLNDVPHSVGENLVWHRDSPSSLIFTKVLARVVVQVWPLVIDGL
jgi:hypothetical protein